MPRAPVTEAGDGTSAEPGFGEMAGGADLPSMVDTLPTFDEDYGSEGDGPADSPKDRRMVPMASKDGDSVA